MTDRVFNNLMENHVIVMYDGVCGFCASSIQFILKQRPTKKIRFVSFQSDMGSKIRNHLNINESMDSIIVVENQKYYKKSKAIFRVFNHIDTGWKYLKIFRFIPAFISDFFYDIIARNRYKIKNNSCQLLTAEERELFI